MLTDGDLRFIRSRRSYRIYITTLHAICLPLLGLAFGGMLMLADAPKAVYQPIVIACGLGAAACILVNFISVVTGAVSDAVHRRKFLPDPTAQLQFSKMVLSDLIHPFTWRTRRSP